MPRPTRFYSTQQEKKVAKALGGKRVANSGATMFSKGDVSTDLFLVECKTCTEPRKSFTLQREWFDKNREEAFAMHRDYSVVVFSFGDDENFYVVDEDLFKQLNNYLKEKENNQ